MPDIFDVKNADRVWNIGQSCLNPDHLLQSLKKGLFCLAEENRPAMREVLCLLLLACFFSGKTALVRELHQPQVIVEPEMDITTLTGDTIVLTNGTTLQIAPTATPIYNFHKNLHSIHGRKLGDFRECSPCTCCDSSRQWCLPTLCCYHINCGVRDLPFGLCSFTPISCSCLGCRD
uniref:DUF7866 domain-containing protein n=2 Tax=Physcomitrium patens TaxID=3218 RepID=A0A7I4FR85_PHYPA